MTEFETQEQERFIDKVNKLIAKMESTTPEEAEAIAAKVTELMERHAIDESMLAAARGESTPDKIVEKTIPFKGIYASSHRLLMSAVGHGSGFRNLQNRISQSHHVGYWIGFEREVATAEMLLASLLLQAERAQREFMKSRNVEHQGYTAFEKATARRSFLDGFAEGVQSTMVKARRHAQEQAKADYAAAAPEHTTGERTDGTPSVALVLASRDQQINDWVDKRYGKLRATRSRSRTHDYSAGSAGRVAGQNADLGKKGVGGSRGALGKGK
jgi:hypothetical protein